MIIRLRLAFAQFLITSAILSAGAFARANSIPTYKMDLDFISHGPMLANGSEAESDAYNSDSANQAGHPIFTEQAMLHLGDRTVRVYLIASRHDGDADVRYVESELARLHLNPQTSTLFVEQGDPEANDGSTTALLTQIKSRAPELLPSVARAQKNPRSILSPDFFQKLTFAQVARHWQTAGGHAVNMDLAQNFEPNAIQFLVRNLEKSAAHRFLRLELDNETFTFAEVRRLMKVVYSPPYLPSEIDQLKDCCGNARDWTNTFLSDNQVRDLTRERYMRMVISSQIKDGDIILTHPVHMRHLLSPELRPNR